MSEAAQTDSGLRRLGLRALLLVVALAFLLVGVLMLVPLKTMVPLVDTFWIWAPQKELTDYGDNPLAYYVLRTGAITHVWMGVILLLPFRDPVRFRPVIHITMVALLVLGVTCFVAGLSGQVAVLVFTLDGLLCFGAAVGLWLLRPRGEGDSSEA